MSYGVGYRLGSDPTLLWLWCRRAATALIRPLAWEPPHAEGAAQEMAKRQKKKNKLSRTVGIHGVQGVRTQAVGEESSVGSWGLGCQVGEQNGREEVLVPGQGRSPLPYLQLTCRTQQWGSWW